MVRIGLGTSPTFDGLLLSTLVLVIVLVLAILLWRRLTKLERRLDRLMRGPGLSNVEEVLNSQGLLMNQLKQDVERFATRAEVVDRKLSGALQHVGIVRFNAFADTGSDLSFAVALLDSDFSGLVLTGLYGRDESRTYLKPIRRGQSPYQLSDEEREALQQAMGTEHSSS